MGGREQARVVQARRLVEIFRVARGAQLPDHVGGQTSTGIIALGLLGFFVDEA